MKQLLISFLKQPSLYISLAALIISAASFYYAHLRRSKIKFDTGDKKSFEIRGQGWKHHLPNVMVAELKPFFVNEGGSAGIIENIDIEFYDLPEEFRKSQLRIGIEKEYGNMRPVRSRLYIKEGEIMPFVVAFDISFCKQVEDPEDYNRIIKGLKRLDQVYVKISYKTRWPLKQRFKKLYLNPTSVIKEVERKK
jgi:hypothetical protein